jgi:hypothetical protein
MPVREPPQAVQDLPQEQQELQEQELRAQPEPQEFQERLAQLVELVVQPELSEP